MPRFQPAPVRPGPYRERLATGEGDRFPGPFVDRIVVRETLSHGKAHLSSQRRVWGGRFVETPGQRWMSDREDAERCTVVQSSRDVARDAIKSGRSGFAVPVCGSSRRLERLILVNVDDVYTVGNAVRCQKPYWDSPRGTGARPQVHSTP